MKCQVCNTDKIKMREYEIEKDLPVYHTSIFYQGRRTKEIDIVFCGAKCSLDYYQHIQKEAINES